MERAGCDLGSVGANVSAFKERTQTSLRRLGVYERAKASCIYDFYWGVADKRVIDDRRREIDFYRNVLEGFRKGDLIYDVGANQGYKTDIFLRLGARVVAVEPDDMSQEILKQRFLKWRVKRKPLLIVPKAVSDRGSIETMWIDAPGSAKNSLSRKWAETLRGDESRFGQRLNFGHRKEVETISIGQLFDAYGLPLFVKIDVEGYEMNVLSGMERAVPYLSFEVNLPEFRPEGLECVRMLGRLARHGKFNYTPDCRHGLALKEWLGTEEFLGVLNSCSDASIEVFWKSIGGEQSLVAGPVSSLAEDH